MAESRVIPSGRLYRQMFDAQVQLSLSLRHSRGGRTAPETHTHTANRLLATSAEQQLEEEVRGLPDVVVADRPSADVIQRLRDKREREHSGTVKNLRRDLVAIGKGYEGSSRSTCQDLLSSLQELDQRLETLVDGMEAQQEVGRQELNDGWKQIRDTVDLKREGIRELDQNLTGYENQRTQQIAALFRKYCPLLERISFVDPCDVYRLLDAEAMMINSALLANRRSIARLQLHLLEDVLQKESVLRLRWQDRCVTWTSGRVCQEVERIRELVSSESVQNPDSVQQAGLEIQQTRRALSAEQRRLIQHIGSLVPPTCTTALVTDWYNQLTAVNQEIECCHDRFLCQLQSGFEQSWQDCLVEVERCKEALCTLELSEEQVQHILSSQILSLIGSCQRQAEDRLAILDRDVHAVARHAGTWSRTVWKVLRGAALLWETHGRAVENREKRLEEQLCLLRRQQEEEIEGKEAHLDVLLDRLRQESTKEALKVSLGRALVSLHDIASSSHVWYSKMDAVLEGFPALLVDELNTYSAAVSQYYHVADVHTLTTEELRSFYHHENLDWNSIKRHMTSNCPISTHNELDPTQAVCDGLLKEAESSLVEIYTADTEVMFRSKRGRAYNGPAFDVPAQDPLGSLGDGEQLILFPAEMLTQTLTQMRVLFFDHLEQRFHDVLSSSLATVTSRKQALGVERERRLQLHQRRPQRIEMDIHNLRSAELHVHAECVSSHCAAVLRVLDSCRSGMADLRTSTSDSNVRFVASVSAMEELFHAAATSHALEGFSSTLQDRLGRHIQETQQSQRAFRRSVQQQLEQLRASNAKLVASFRLFGDGGNFSPREVEQLLGLLERTSQRTEAWEDDLQADTETLESSSLEQVRQAVERLEEKLAALLVEARFSEKIQKVLANVQVQIKAEAAHNNQQKVLISSQLEELRRLTETAEVSQEKVLTCLSSLCEGLKTRYKYLHCAVAPSNMSPAPQHPLQGSFAVAARPRSKPSRPSSRDLPLAAAGVGGASSGDIPMDVAKGLNKSRRLPRTGKNNKWFQMFGSEPDLGQSTRSFKSTVKSFLRTANEVLLLAAEDLYKKSEFDQWAERLTKRLLGYQEQTNQFNTTSVQEFGQQLCELEEVVCTLPRVMFGNYGQQQEVELLTEVEEFRTRMEETTNSTNHSQRVHASQLRVRLGHPACKEELDALRRREEDRQSQYRSAINRTYEELQREGIRELDQNLTGYENQRTQQIAALFRKYCPLLERISFVDPCDVYRLLDAEAMMINSALLANRRSIARLQLHLLEDVLQKESVLRLRWQDRCVTWTSGRVCQEVERIRELVSSESVQNPDSVQQAGLEIQQTRRALSAEQRRLIQHIGSLVPPTCTTALVTDWYNQLTAVNQEIECCHDRFLCQLQSGFEQSWQDCLVEVERCKEALCTLELSEEQVQHILSSQILSLIGSCQRQAEDRLAILDRDVHAVARHAGTWSRTVWKVLRGAALLWETHGRAVENREKRLEEQLCLLRRQQEEEIEGKEAHLDVLLDRLRQESTKEALKVSLGRALVSLHDIASSSHVWYSKMDAVLEGFPALLVDELNTYSAAVSQYYHVADVHTLTTEELRSFYHHENLDWNSIKRHMTSNCPISTHNELDPTQAVCDGLLKEAESSLVEIYTADTEVMFRSKRGRAYNGPAFDVPAQDPLGSLGDGEQLILFPAEMLTQTLTQMRVLFFDHLEQRFHDVLSSSLATVTSRKQALGVERERRLQLHQRRPQRIEMDIHNLRSAELHVHAECVSSHCAAVLRVLDSCRSGMADLRTSTSDSNVRFVASVSAMEELFHAAATSHALEGFSSTLQDRLGRHIQETQQSQRAFRRSVQQQLEQLRASNAKLVASFRLFGDGGNFSPREVEQLLGLLERTSQRTEAWEDDLQADTETLESSSLEQVRQAVERLEEKLAALLVEARFSEKIQKVLANVQVQIKAEAAHNNQQKVLISSQLEELRRLTETAEVSQEKVLTCLSSLCEGLKTRYKYLHCAVAPSNMSPAPQHPLQGSFAVAARPRSKPSRPSSRDLPLAAAGVGGASSGDIPMDVAKGLNKSRRLPRTGKNNKWFQMFGSEPDLGQSTRSFKSTVKSFLRTANEVLLLAAEDLYKKSEFDQWAERLTKRLLGYQEQTNQFNTTSVQEFGQQLCELEEVVCTLPRVMFGNYGQQQEVELLTEVEEFRTRMEETTNSTNHSQRVHASQLRVRLGHPACKEELDALRRREEDRQSQYRSAINRTYEELQETLQAREEAVATALASLTETLVSQVDAVLSFERSERLAAPDAEAGRDWLMPNSFRKSSSSSSRTLEPCVDATATAAPVSSPVQQEIIIHRDRALKHHEAVSRAESERFRVDRDQLLIQLQRWTQHWNQQINTLSTLTTE